MLILKLSDISTEDSIQSMLVVNWFIIEVVVPKPDPTSKT